VLWNDPATGVMRHADAGYDIAIDCAREHGLRLPASWATERIQAAGRARRSRTSPTKATNAELDME
jgi:hypothetical protein